MPVCPSVCSPTRGCALPHLAAGWSSTTSMLSSTALICAASYCSWVIRVYGLCGRDSSTMTLVPFSLGSQKAITSAASRRSLVGWHVHRERNRVVRVVQAPAMDGGSPQFTDYSGMDARPGVLSFGMLPEHRVYDIQAHSL